MTIMIHPEHGQADIDPKRVKKLLKRGWTVYEEPELENNETLDEPEEDKGDV